MKKIRKYISVLIILITVLIMAAGTVSATEYDASIFNKTVPENIKYINVNHKELAGTKYDFDAPYSDDFFNMPSYKFNHTMARASIGMAVSAMRDWDVPEDQGHNIIRFLSEAGFEDIEASLYRTEPTENSICYAMANKEIDDYKVLCIALCGAGYKKEWISNLLVGDDERHQGFNEAAKKVETAIYEYSKANNIRGKVKVWITGYSRSAAVGNLVAQDLISSGIYEDLYAYLFATPRTTKNPIPYKNIFNIIGKNDFVPKIPLAEWGYGRNGIELYTKTQETDSDYIYAYLNMNHFTAEHDMQAYLNNPELNYQIRTFFDYMSQLMPTSADYKMRLQDILISAMRDTSKDNILSSIVLAMQQFIPVTREEEVEVSEMLDYLQLLINQYVLQGNEKQIAEGYWNPNISLADNFTAEHDPARYVTWMYSSDDVNDIFSPDTEYIKLTIEGDCTVDIRNNKGYILSINSLGDSYYDGEEDDYEEFIRLYADDKVYTAIETETDRTKKVITLPLDRKWTLAVTADKTAKKGISYIAVGLSGTTSKAKISNYYSINTTKDETYYITIDKNGDSLINEKESYFTESSEYLSSFYSASLVMKIDRLNIPYLTLQNIVAIIVILVLVAVLDLILSITLGIIRVVRKKKRRSGATITLHCINIAIFAMLEIILWIFASAFPIVRYGNMVLTCLIIAGLALKGLENKSKKTWRIVVLIIIGILMIAHVLTEIFVLKTIVKYEWLEPVIAYFIMTALSCILYKRSPEEKEMQKKLEEDLKLKRIEKKQNRKLKRQIKKGILTEEILKEKLVMKNLIIPKDYDPKLTVRQTEEAIKYIRDTFQKEFGTEMNLERISAPLYVRKSSGLNDDLSGVERKVSFDAKELPGDELEIVQSLAKWKRWALGHYGFKAGEGLYTNMNAIRRDEELDNLHSIYVDQWDWERVITKEERTEKTLKETVEKIFKIIKHMEHEVWYKYPEAVYHLPDEIFFIDSEELRKLYPDLSPKERENAICKDKGAVFIMKIGDKLGDGKPHDGRAPDYDDWQLNGDILFWFEPLQQAFEISSMGIRVDEVSMRKQLEKAGKIEKLELTYHKMIMNKELPYTIGGGIGQSRLCMLLLGRAHVGEVQASVWPDEMLKLCEENNIKLL